MARTGEEATGQDEARTGPVREHAAHRTQLRLDEAKLRARIDAVLNRHPAVGLAVGIIRDGSFEFCGRGFADLASGVPISEDTVFRVGSITKVFTAIALMQLCEEGLVDLDAPASNYLRSYQLVSAPAGFRRPTLRHLLTHTSGIPDVRRIVDLFHPDLSVKFGEPLPSLAEYYRGGLRVLAQPGTVFAYSNHGFAPLGQIEVGPRRTPVHASPRRRGSLRSSWVNRCKRRATPASQAR